MDRHTDQTTVLSFRVPTEHALWVKRRCEEAGMTPNKGLRLWLAESIARKEDSDATEH